MYLATEATSLFKLIYFPSNAVNRKIEGLTKLECAFNGQYAAYMPIIWLNWPLFVGWHLFVSKQKAQRNRCLIKAQSLFSFSFFSFFLIYMSSHKICCQACCKNKWLTPHRHNSLFIWHKVYGLQCLKIWIM